MQDDLALRVAEEGKWRQTLEDKQTIAMQRLAEAQQALAASQSDASGARKDLVGLCSVPVAGFFSLVEHVSSSSVACAAF